jgi:hypothetical protein
MSYLLSPWPYTFKDLFQVVSSNGVKQKFSTLKDIRFIPLYQTISVVLGFTVLLYATQILTEYFYGYDETPYSIYPFLYPLIIALILYRFCKNPICFALAVIVLVSFEGISSFDRGSLTYQSRNFYGIYPS